MTERSVLCARKPVPPAAAILSGALDVDVECCERCKKLEFYLLGDAEAPESSGIQQIACPYCGDLHDMDDAICPHCGRRLMEL